MFVYCITLKGISFLRFIFSALNKIITTLDSQGYHYNWPICNWLKYLNQMDISCGLKSTLKQELYSELVSWTPEAMQFLPHPYHHLLEERMISSVVNSFLLPTLDIVQFTFQSITSMYNLHAFYWKHIIELKDSPNFVVSSSKKFNSCWSSSISLIE